MRNNLDDDLNVGNIERDTYSGLSQRQIKGKEKKKLIFAVVAFIVCQFYIYYQYHTGEAIVSRGPNVFLAKDPEGFYNQLIFQEILFLGFLIYGLYNYYINKSVLFPKN